MSSWSDIQALISNRLVEPHELSAELTTTQQTSFAAILGANPSQGARSPALWNAAFQAHGIAASMLPMDVTAENLPALLQTLEQHPHFLGGAIAMPHKESIARWLGKRCTPEAQAIGAVNCLFRTADGKLAGTNTDGEAARAALEEKFGKISGKRVLLLGPGGAGKAVAAYIAAAGAHLTIASRRGLESSTLQALGAQQPIQQILWHTLDQALPNTDIVINCTSLGMSSASAALPKQSPLTAAQLAQLPQHALVYDIIYQPVPSYLLQLSQARGLATLDGVAMNLYQAILAYGYAAPAPHGAETTATAMRVAKQKM